MGCLASKDLTESTISAAKAMFAAQNEMATGKVDDKMMQKFMEDYGKHFSSSFNMKTSSGVDLKKIDFKTCLQAVYPTWEGLNNTSVTDGEYAIVEGTNGSTIQWPHTFDTVAMDADGNNVDSTRNTAFEVINTVTFNAAGKVVAWSQEYDYHYVRKAKRDALIATSMANAERYFVVYHTFKKTPTADGDDGGAAASEKWWAGMSQMGKEDIDKMTEVLY